MVNEGVIITEKTVHSQEVRTMKIKFVFVSKDNDFLMDEDDFSSVMKSDSLSVYTDFISDNKIDLPTIYN